MYDSLFEKDVSTKMESESRGQVTYREGMVVNLTLL